MSLRPSGIRLKVVQRICTSSRTRSVMHHVSVRTFFYFFRASAIRLIVRAADNHIIALPTAFHRLFDRQFVTAYYGAIYTK